MTRVAVIGAGSWGTAVAAIVAGERADRAVGAAPELADAHRRRRTRTPTTCPASRCPSALHAHRRSSRRRAPAPTSWCRGAVARVARGAGRGARRSSTPSARDREPRQGHRAGNAAAHDRGDRRGARRSRPGSHRRAHRPEPRARGRGRPADRVGRRGARRRGRRGAAAACSSRRRFRVYTNPDVIGCEMAGALKNVLAIGAGIADGLGYGDNTKAALITRGLAELARLGRRARRRAAHVRRARGHGRSHRDVRSPQSRNRHVGVELGQGRALDDIVERDEHGGRRREDDGGGARARRTRTRWRCRSRRSSGACSTRARGPADLVPELMLRKAKPELHGMR